MRVVFMAASLHFCCCGLPLLARESAPMPAADELDSADSDAQAPRDIPLPRASIEQSSETPHHSEAAEERSAVEESAPMPTNATSPELADEGPTVPKSVKVGSSHHDRPHEAIPETPPASAPDENDTVGGDDITNSGPFAATFDDLPPPAGVKIDAAAFNGVQPGKTTTEELIQLWGEGKVASEPGAENVRSYKLESFPRIDVTLNDNVVKSIVVQLAKPLSTAVLAKQLQIADVRPVNIPDETGQPLGQAYPERGVLLTYAPGGKLVSHVSLEKIDYESFVLRAEMNLDTQCRRSQADLEYVLQQQPQHARAHYLRAKLLLSLRVTTRRSRLANRRWPPTKINRLTACSAAKFLAALENTIKLPKRRKRC